MKNHRVILTALMISLSTLIPFSSLSADDDSGFTSFMEDSGSETQLVISGTGSLKERYMINYDSPESTDVINIPEVNLNIEYTGNGSDFFCTLEAGGMYDFSSPEDIKRFLDNIVDEIYTRVYFPAFDLEAGLMKIVWGKGDEIFTFDNINSSDYSDFMNTSYVERKAAEPMIKINIPFGEQGLAELLYTPCFTPDTIPVSGDWVQHEYEELLSAIKDALTPEDTKTLSHFQGGIRLTDSLGGIDFGAAYEYTYLREPVISPADIVKFTIAPATQIPVTYDRVHIFGIEGAAVLAGFNLRAEGAYYLTEDTAGDDPDIHNCKVQYLAGFDRDIPVHNININIQVRGELKLNSDNIDSNGAMDLEYSDDSIYFTNIAAGELRDNFLNEKLVLKVNGAYSAGGKDYMISPGIEYSPKDNVLLKLSGTFYDGDSDTLFGQFSDNDMIQASVEYSF